MGPMLCGCLKSGQGACSSHRAHRLGSNCLCQVFDFNGDSWATFCMRQSCTTVAPASGRQLFLQIRRLAAVYWYWSVFRASGANSARQLGVFVEKLRAPQAAPEVIEERARVWRLYRSALRAPTAPTQEAAEQIAPGSTRTFTHPLWSLLFTLLNEGSSLSSRSTKQLLRSAQSIRPEFRHGLGEPVLQTRRFWSHVVKDACFLDRLFVALLMAKHAACEMDPDALRKWQHCVYTVTLLQGWRLSKSHIHGPFLDLLDHVFSSLSQNLEVRIGVSRMAHLRRMGLLVSRFLSDPNVKGKTVRHFDAWMCQRIWGPRGDHIEMNLAISPDVVPVDPSNLHHRIAAAQINCEQAEFYQRYSRTLDAVMREHRR